MKPEIPEGYVDSGLVHSFDKFCRSCEVSYEDRQQMIKDNAWPYAQDGATIYTNGHGEGDFFSHIMFSSTGELLVTDTDWAVPRKGE